MHDFHLLTSPVSRPAALIVGALLLLAGRRLFWLLVGVVGFFAAYSLSLQVLHLRPAGLELLIAVMAGLIGVLLAIFLQKVAIAIAGFLLGVYFAAELMGVALGPSSGHALSALARGLTPGQELVALVAGVLAALLAVGLFDLALVVLSALAGASLVSDALQVGGSVRLLLFVALAAVGIAIQASWSRRSRARAV
jgi:hypothetical protein